MLVCLPSWVTLACDPSGGTKVMEHGFGLTGWAGSSTMLVCLLQVEI